MHEYRSSLKKHEGPSLHISEIIESERGVYLTV